MCLAGSLAGAAYGIDPERAMSQVIRDRWGVEQGFPRGAVYAISQSSDGYLWIGTQAGLVRFDGLAFRLFHEIPGLQTEPVLGLMADGDGSVWIRMERRLLRYRNGVFDDPAPWLLSRITTMSRADSGELLLSATERGEMVFRNGQFETVAPATAIPRSPVLSVAQTADGLWIGTRGAGLFRFFAGRATAITENLPDLKINSLLRGDGGDLWVGTDSGVVRWNGDRLVAAGTASLSQVQVLSLQRDRDGNIWAGTDSKGLMRITERGVSYFDEPSHGAVTALFEDREGDLWAGSADGIERLRDTAFSTYSTQEGLPPGGSKAIFADLQNRLWFGPAEGGLWWMKNGATGRISNDGLDHDVVYSMAGNKDEFWLGRQRGGLTRVDTSGSQFSFRTYTRKEGLAQDSVFCVYQARDSSVWAGTLSAGVSHFQDGRFTTYTTTDGLLSNTVAAILEGSGGSMWFATTGGLNELAQGHWHAHTVRNGLPSDNVYSLLEDSSGVLWIGTAAGLAVRSGEKIDLVHGAGEWLREPIFGIEEDRQGALWVATSHRVLRVNREKLLHGTLRDGDLREFGTADGLRGTAPVRRYRSVMRDPSGRIWFSLNRGISVVDPLRLKHTTAPAIVHLQSISADGADIPIGSSIHIPGGRRRVTFGFAGLSLAAPELVRFRYRLDGYDSAWSDAGSLREWGYTNLGPRRYRFRVIASNPDGVWNSAESAIAFEVDPLFWQTWWFSVSMAFGCAGAIFGFYRFRTRQLTARLNVRFEERLAERTRIAQELHDTLLQGFLSASMQIHVGTDSLPEDSKVKPIFTRALQLMRQVIDEGRNAIRGLRSSAGPSLDLEDAFSRVPQEPAAKPGSGAGFRVVIEGQQRSLNPLLRDDVYRIGREALINSFRHSRAKNIEVVLKYSTRQLHVLVRDDGRGIDPHVLQVGRDGHWGLPGMRERAEQIGARLRVYSSAAAGTEVELSVPGYVAYRDHSVRKHSWFSKRNPLITAPPRESTNGKGNGE